MTRAAPVTHVHRPDRRCIKGVTALWPLKLPDHVAAPGDYGELVPASAARRQG